MGPHYEKNCIVECTYAICLIADAQLKTFLKPPGTILNPSRTHMSTVLRTEVYQLVARRRNIGEFYRWGYERMEWSGDVTNDTVTSSNITAILYRGV